MISAALVVSGGFFGAICRFAISQWFIPRVTSFPVGTLLINLLGSFLLGWITGSAPDESWQLFFGTGFMGAFTTFSTFKWESIQMIINGEKRNGVFYLGISYFFGILFAYVGYLFGSSITS
ncbi:fluoride efflux transporter CrcB [Anoxybacillus sp. J5B_2022]|uniref:fluoride efflux transporter CrcB n=1 Tax=Anoxybacillus sp. J5B_2022 TaxID=3003246 RepID=UPI002286B1A2|nr:fluoride efflux transporter CrcB [Anoxybacillus sp. J5B_2022]MCZ0756601.1 fluoride efflux transporter CrcB [Anoxybacillus sp. J5B_2022]